MQKAPNVLLQVAPDSPLGVRLRLAGHPCEMASIYQSIGGKTLAATFNSLKQAAGLNPDRSEEIEARLWVLSEDYLWNDLLPLQTSLGQFITEHSSLGPLSHEHCVESFSNVLAGGVAFLHGEMSINLPIQSSGSFELEQDIVRWRLETAYPQEGSLSLTLFPETEADFVLRVRSDGLAESGPQLLRNGIPCPIVVDQGYLRLDGPWQFGDHVELRFGLPFTVRAEEQKPVSSSYPGAPPVPNASIWHGCRQLLALPAEPNTSDDRVSSGSEIAIGVRKDGVLLLKAQSDTSLSPFTAPGDIFLSTDTPPRRLVARSLQGSLEGEPRADEHTVTFRPFETSFDRGA